MCVCVCVSVCMSSTCAVLIKSTHSLKSDRDAQMLEHILSKPDPDDVDDPDAYPLDDNVGSLSQAATKVRFCLRLHLP